MADIITISVTGAAAISYTCAPGNNAELIDFRLKLSAVPTTSEDFTATINANAGAVYDIEAYRKDLSLLSDPSLIVIGGSDEFVVEAGGSWDFAYTNTDEVTYGLQIRYRRKV